MATNNKRLVLKVVYEPDQDTPDCECATQIAIACSCWVQRVRLILSLAAAWYSSTVWTAVLKDMDLGGHVQGILA